MITTEMLQEKAFRIITDAGLSKQKCLEGLALSKQSKFDEMLFSFAEAKKSYALAHEHHRDIVQAEAEGKEIPYSVLFSHAEDQLLAAENTYLFCTELAELYKNIKK